MTRKVALTEEQHLRLLLSTALEEGEAFALRAYDAFKVVDESRNKALVTTVLAHAIVVLAAFDVLSAAAMLNISDKSPYLMPSALMFAAFTYFNFGLTQLKHGYFTSFFALRSTDGDARAHATSLLLMPAAFPATAYMLPALVSRTHYISNEQLVRSGIGVLTGVLLALVGVSVWFYTLYAIWSDPDGQGWLTRLSVVVYALVFILISSLYGPQKKPQLYEPKAG